MPHSQAHPTLNEKLRIWICRTAAKNHWRVFPWYDFDDLVQDGYVVYYKVWRRYVGVRERRHITNTFKRAYNNHIIDLANKRTKCPREVRLLDLPAPTMEEEEDWSEANAFEHLVPPEEEAQSLCAQLRQAPPEVQAVLALFDDPRKLRLLRAPYYRRKNGSRETLNERLCRIAGIPKFDIIEMMCEYLDPVQCMGIENAYDNQTHRIRCGAPDTGSRVQVLEFPRTSLRLGGDVTGFTEG